MNLRRLNWFDLGSIGGLSDREDDFLVVSATAGCGLFARRIRRKEHPLGDDEESADLRNTNHRVYAPRNMGHFLFISH